MSDNTVAYITLAGIGVVLISSIMKYCYRSKCETIDLCCGCLHIERNVEIEEENDIGHGHSTDSSSNNTIANMFNVMKPSNASRV